MNNSTILIKLFEEAFRSFFLNQQREWRLVPTFLIGALLCLGSSSMMASPATTSVYVEFTNTGCETVHIYWLDDDDDEYVYYYTLNGGQSYTQQTYDGHTWLFTLGNGTHLGTYTANHNHEQSHDIHSGGCDNGGTDCSNVPNSLSGFIYLGQFGDSKYFCSNTNNFEWDEAVASATANGGTLAVINSEEENDFLADHILATAWIGYTDEAHEGTFVWVNGDPTTFTKWSYGEPNNQGVNGGYADYTVMTPGNGKWKDRNGHDHYEFILEIPCPEVCVGDVADAGTFSPGSVTGCGPEFDAPIIEIAAGTCTDGSTPSYRWEVKEDANNGTWETIAGATNRRYDPPAVTGSTWFRRFTICPCEEEKTSNIFDVHVKASPMVTVSTTPADCDGNGGSVTFSFNDRNDRTNIEFSIDGGATYPAEFNVSDASGSLTIDLAPGTYHLFTRWGNNECPVDLGNETISTPPADECTDCPTTFFNGGLIEANEAECKIESINPPDFNGEPLEIVWIKSPNSQDCAGALNELGPINVGAAYDAFLAAGGIGVADAQIGNTSWMFAFDGDNDDLTFDATNIFEPTCFFRCVRPVGCERFFGEAGPVTISCTPPPGPDCPAVPDDIPGFIYLGEFDDSKYYCSSTNNFEWDEAIAEAEANGGFLAVINSEEENDFLADHILATAWIGYTDEANEGTFVWVNGDPTTYTKWSSGEPNNQGVNGGSADYTVMIPGNGKWKDRNGHDHYEFIMEIPCPIGPTPPSDDCEDELIASWDLEACYSNSGDGSNYDYSEFTAVTNDANCTSVTATNVMRMEGAHSCTPGQEGKAMCIGTQSSCDANDLNENYAVKFSVTINPDESGKLSSLSFYEKAPTHYDWIGGASGQNNYPTKYLLKVKKGNTVIFEQVDIPTTQEYTLETFDFSDNSAFEVTETTTFTFLLRAYCRVGNYADVSVWDLDEIKVFGGCCEPEPPVCPDPSAGTLTLDGNGDLECMDGCVTASATPNGDKFIPDGYSEIYVLTSGAGLVIEQVNSAPEFTVCAEGAYTIHTLVYDPATLDLNIVVPGQTTGFDVNGLLIQGGGDICASLDVAGAPFNAPDCSCPDPNAGSLTLDVLPLCIDGCITATATPNGDKFIPDGYSEIYVLTSGAGLVIEQVNSAPEFTVCAEGLYTIHTLVYDPATLDLNIVVPGQTTGFDVNSLINSRWRRHLRFAGCNRRTIQCSK